MSHDRTRSCLAWTLFHESFCGNTGAQVAQQSWCMHLLFVFAYVCAETMGKMFIINAPRIFSMAWSIVKGMLDERTREKVCDLLIRRIVCPCLRLKAWCSRTRVTLAPSLAPPCSGRRSRRLQFHTCGCIRRFHSRVSSMSYGGCLLFL